MSSTESTKPAGATRPDSVWVRYIFLRSLALIYLAAFWSLNSQIIGLAGHNGIVPADQFMSQVRAYVEQQHLGASRYFLEPTLCWFNVSNSFLRGLCVTGIVVSLLLLAGIASPICLAILWLLYLSLTTVCGVFLQFQWDNLLLEMGLLAIFLGPFNWFSRPAKERSPSLIIVWLFRWLLFRLMFQSGCVKLLSGDPLWHNLTALSVHYETQPLPTWIGWYAEDFVRVDVLHRSCGPFSHLRASPHSRLGGAATGRLANRHPSHRELLLLQLAYHRFMPVSAGR